MRAYVHRVESHELVLFDFDNCIAITDLEISAVSEVLANVNESDDIFGNVVDAGPLVGRNAQ